MGSAVLGAAAVLGAIASFGSFGVPIKSRRLQEAQVEFTQCYSSRSHSITSRQRACAAHPGGLQALQVAQLRCTAPRAGAPDNGAGLQERGVFRNVLARAACRAAALHLVGHFRRCNLGAQLSGALRCPASLHLSLV